MCDGGGGNEGEPVVYSEGEMTNETESVNEGESLTTYLTDKMQDKLTGVC